MGIGAAEGLPHDPALKRIQSRAMDQLFCCFRSIMDLPRNVGIPTFKTFNGCAAHGR